MKRILNIFLLFLILLTALLSFLLNSNAGLHSMLFIAKRVAPGQLHYRGANGSIVSPLTIKTLQYEDDSQKISITDLRLRWSPLALWHKEFLLQKLSADTIDIETKKTAENNIQTPNKTASTWPQLPLEFTLLQLHVRALSLNDTLVKNIQASAKLNNTKWELHNFSAIFEKVHYQLHGNIIPTPPYQSNFLLSMEGLASDELKIKGQLRFKGDSSKYVWDGQLQQPYPIVIKGHLDNLSTLDTTILSPSINYQPNAKQHFKISDTNIRIQGQYPHFTLKAHAAQQAPISSSIAIQAKTDLKTLQMQSNIRSGSGFIHNTIDASLEGSHYIKAYVNANNIDLKPFDIPFSIDELTAHYSASDTSAKNAKLQLKGQSNGLAINASARLEDKQIHATIEQGNNSLRLNGALTFPMTIALDLAQPATLNPALQGLSTAIKGTIQVQNEKQAQADIQIAKGQWQNQDDSSVPALQFNGGSFSMRLNDKGLRAQGNLTIDAFKTVLVSLQLPDFSLQESTKPLQAIQGQVQLKINNLNFLQELSPVITSASGSIEGQLSLNGTFATPKINGNIQVKQAALSANAMGIAFNPINATLTTSGGKWQLSGSIGSNKSSLHVQGRGAFMPSMQGEITIKGDNVLLINSNEYIVYLSPDLKIKIEPNLTLINGSILVPRATIKPQTFSSSDSLSSDVVFASEKKPQSNSKVQTDITISMGDKVELDIKGLTALAKGQIQIQNQSSGPFNATGKLSIKDGKYTAYGQDLTIERGELLFSGGQISNPGINVRAVRNFSSSNTTFVGSNRFFDFGSSNLQTVRFSSQTTVGIQISGRISQLNIKLFSEPGNLSQADILSMMLLGRPASQASGAGGQILLAAISSMDLGDGSKGTQLLSQLQSALGLSFDVQNNSSYDQQSNTVSESRALAVSKAFSKRLSLSYNMGLSNFESNGITLKYLLNRFFNIQVSASTEGSGIDFVYSHQQDK